MLNHASYHVCAITYVLNMSMHIFEQSYFVTKEPKARHNKHYDVDVKTYLHDVKIVIQRQCTTCVILKSRARGYKTFFFFKF